MTFNFIKNPLLAFVCLLLVCSCETTEKRTDKEEEFISIFNGVSLEGWRGDTTYWRVEDSVLIGEVTPETILKRNSFIIWEGGEVADFELVAQYRISERGNSGVNYRSVELDTLPYAMRGYQADIDGALRYAGMNYEERGRTILALRGQKVVLPQVDMPISDLVEKNFWTASEVIGSVGGYDSLAGYISPSWNEIRIVAKGNNMKHYINNVLMCEVIDRDTANSQAKGLIGFQVHTGPPMSVRFRKVRLRAL